MTFAYREMQATESKGIFQLEFAGHSHTHRTLNEMIIFAMGTPCQKI